MMTAAHWIIIGGVSVTAVVIVAVWLRWFVPRPPAGWMDDVGEDGEWL